MPTIQQKIADRFIVKLAESDAVDTGKIEKLRTLLTETKKPKVEDFVKIFTISDAGDLK